MTSFLEWLGAKQSRRAAAAEPGDRPSCGRRSLLILAALGMAFLLVRLPLMYRQPGHMDEEYYALPGLAILENGIPRLPHVPERNPDGVFYLADRAFFGEPPLYFYWQALFYALLPDVYGTGRLASAVAGLVSVWLVFELARTLYRDDRAALLAAAIYSLARTFLRPATTARPDMLCAMFGLAALVCVAKWQESHSRRWLLGVGLLLGLAGLTHPAAIVFAVQAAVWVSVASSGRGRLTHPLVVAGTAVTVFLLWSPLILAYPEEFREQFSSNILRPGGSGLLHRLVVFWPSFQDQGARLLDLLLPPQFALLLGGTVLATVRDLRGSPRGHAAAWLLAWSSLYLLSVMAGHHPTYHHWSYPTALLAICTGRGLVSLYDLSRRTVWRRGLAWGGGVLLVLVLLKATGLRAWTAHLAHWNNINYNAPAFARRILSDFPPDARYAVDPDFALDFYVAGRNMVIAEVEPNYLSVRPEYDYLAVSRYGLEWDTPADWNGELVRTYGDREDLFSCYAEVYRRARRVDDDE